MADTGTQNKNTDAYAQLRYLQNAYSQQYELIEEQMATYSISLESVRKGIEFLADAKKASNTKTLINIGGGAYTLASFPEIKSILVYVGAGYLVEQSLDVAKEYVDNGRKKQEETLRKLDNERKKLQGELMGIAYKMEEMQQKQQV